MGVQILHGQPELPEELTHHALRQPATGPDQPRQVTAAAQLHRDVYVAGNRPAKVRTSEGHSEQVLSSMTNKRTIMTKGRH